MQIDPFLFLLLVELLLVTTAVAITVVVVTLSRKQRDKQAAKTLVGRIKEDRSRRKDETRDVLVSRYGLDEEVAKELSTQIDRGERYFYQTLINTYLQRDHLLLENLNVEFEGSIEPYRTLAVPERIPGAEEAAAEEDASGAVAEAVDGDTAAECERLRIENARLSEELRITMETMGRMLSEYSSMFGGGSGEGMDAEKLKEMMEQAVAGIQGGEPPAQEPPADEARQEETPSEAPGEPAPEEIGEAPEEIGEAPEEMGEAQVEETADGMLDETVVVEEDAGLDDFDAEELFEPEDDNSGPPEPKPE